jgi:hypothetical protein
MTGLYPLPDFEWPADEDDGREPVRAFAPRPDLARQLRERFARIAASRWATAPLSAWDAPREPRRVEVAPAAPRPATEDSRRESDPLARVVGTTHAGGDDGSRGKSLSNGDASRDSSRIKDGDWVPNQDGGAGRGASRPSGVSRAKQDSEGVAATGSALWWRTLSPLPTRCGECRAEVAAGERFLYRHDDRLVLCRSCGAAAWQDARPSKRLREYADRRRRESRVAA